MKQSVKNAVEERKKIDRDAASKILRKLDFFFNDNLSSKRSHKLNKILNELQSCNLKKSSKEISKTATKRLSKS